MERNVSRRNFVGLAGGSLLAAAFGGGLVGCNSSESGTTNGSSVDLGFDINDWNSVLEAAKGKTVTFQSWGGDENWNNWWTGELNKMYQEKYGVSINLVTEDATSEGVTIVGDEKQAGKKFGEGSIDMVWIDQENFATMKTTGLLYGPINDYLPNFSKYLNADDSFVQMDCGTPVEGYEIPIHAGPFIMVHDTAQTPTAPKTHEEFLEWVKQYPGMITYPSGDDTLGRWFIRNMIYEVCGENVYSSLDANSSTADVKEAIEPAMKFLRDLNPYLWKEGKTYPTTSSNLNTMFSNGEVYMTVDWTMASVGTNIKKGVYKDTAQYFVFDKGTIRGAGSLAPTYNTKSLAAVLVVINEFITPQIQADQLEFGGGYAPSISFDKLTADEKKILDSVDVGKGSMTMSDLGSIHGWANAPYYLVDPIWDIWSNEVAGKTN